MEDDVLRPYARDHGPAHSHRHVRDCQAVLYGNTTHENWPAANHSGLPPAESSTFVTSVPGSSKWVYGQWGWGGGQTERKARICFCQVTLDESILLFVCPLIQQTHSVQV